MRKAIMAIALLVSTAAQGAWIVTVQKDEMTDEKRRFAEVSNSNAILYIYEASAHTFTAGLRVRNRAELIHYEPKTVGVRIDKNPVHIIEFNSWEPRVVFIDLPLTLVDQLISGKSLKVQYPSSRHGTVVETFDLAGAKKAIMAVLDTYKTPAQRDADMAAIERDNAGDVAERKTRAQRECPDVWQKYLAAEARYGQPQMWQGCFAVY